MTEDLITRLQTRDRTIIGRAVSIAENGGANAEKLLQRIDDGSDRSYVIGFTGSPGSGKSTLIDALIQELRHRDKTVAVIAIDPSSPFSGGAILGDRCRMNRHQTDTGVYVRSLSSRGSVGGTSDGARRVIEVLRTCGFDLILVETVGAGQSEVDVTELADLCVVVCTPNMGDDIQAIKSGILEVADILVANKADLADADRTVQQLITAQNLPSNQARQVPVISTIAPQGKGIGELADHLITHGGADNRRRDGMYIERQVARAISRRIEKQILAENNPGFDRICAAVKGGTMDIEQAASTWLEQQ